mmetsp:Transcript_18160/g.47964  ORF Transcript_18160/g.47964 Transcript_18160/m.47964 type:complete len:365 (-) Transcript_18160:40-1134(-)
MAISMPRRAGLGGRRSRWASRAAIFGGVAALVACRAAGGTHAFAVGQRAAGQRSAQPIRTQRSAKETKTLDPTEVFADTKRKAEEAAGGLQEALNRVVNAPDMLSQKAKSAMDQTVEGFAKDDGRILDESTFAGGLGAVAVSAAVLPYIPVSLYSSWLVATTGSGVEAGPNGLYGIAEGLATLVVFAVVAWSLTSLVTRARGLPGGPGSILGATQALSWVAALAFAGATALSGGNNLNPLGERREPLMPEATKVVAKEVDEAFAAPSNFFSGIQKQLDDQMEGAKKQVESQMDGVRKQVDQKASEVTNAATASVSKATSSVASQAAEAAKSATDKAKDATSKASLPKLAVPDYKDLVGGGDDDE